MTRSQDSGHGDGAHPADDRVVLIARSADDARIIRDYLRELPWLEVCTEADERAA
jgi:hypothetical protein